MSFFRKLSRKIFGTYLGNLPTDTVVRYLHVARISYFFSVVTLAGFLYYKIKEFDEKQENVVRGKPITVDRTECM